MPHQTWLHRLLWLLCLVSASRGQHQPVYNCSHGASPDLISPKLMRFSLRLSTEGSTSGVCHALIRSHLIRSNLVYFYVRLSSSLASSSSVLSLSSDSGSSGVPIATVTASNQTAYRAFASASNSLYVRLSGRAADSVLLDVELVHGCPSHWFSYPRGRCFGPPAAAAADSAAVASFAEAAAACRQVRANLVMGYDSTEVLRHAVAVAGWPENSPVWIGAADGQFGVRFLNGKNFHRYDGHSFASFHSGPSGPASECSPPSDCRCLYARGASYHRGRCADRIRFMCSSELGGDHTFYTLELMDKLLEDHFGGEAKRTVLHHYWVIGLAVGLTCAAIAIITRIVFNSRMRRRRVTLVFYHQLPGGGVGGAGGPVAMATTVVPVAPPAYEAAYEKPPAYEEAAVAPAAATSETST